MNGTDELMTALRVVGSIVVVLVLVVLSARLARRAGVRGPGSGLKVIDRTGLTREASVAVIEVAGKALVLGVTSHGVNVLAELDLKEVAQAQAAAAPRGPLPRVVKIPRPVLPQDSTGQDLPRQDLPRQGGRTPRATRPANGSVLSPATWRQGIEALRDLTARKSPR